MSTIKTLEDALDHAELSRDCVSTSAKAMTILADEVRDLKERNERLEDHCKYLEESVECYKEDVEFLETELKEMGRELAYYERGGNWDE